MHVAKVSHAIIFMVSTQRVKEVVLKLRMQLKEGWSKSLSQGGKS